MKDVSDIVCFLDREGVFDSDSFEMPDVGDISEEDDVYQLAYDVAMGEDEGWLSLDNPRLWDWMQALERSIEFSEAELPGPVSDEVGEAVEPHCAWYCPIHFFGHSWGIYIREQCILDIGLDLAGYLTWAEVRREGWTTQDLAIRLLRAAFHVLFLHEQFHHKVESFGLRLHVSTRTTRYVQYKRRVYAPTWPSADCLEESLANADSYRRLSENRYQRKLGAVLVEATRTYLRHAFRRQPPAYSNGLRFLANRAYFDGLNLLQARVLEAVLKARDAGWRLGSCPQDDSVTFPDYVSHLDSGPERSHSDSAYGQRISGLYCIYQ